MPPTNPNESSTWQSLRDAIRLTWPNRHGRSSDVATLIGCSGGADSVALVRLLAEQWAEESRAISGSDEARPIPTAPLVVAHCNHGLRGEESDADEAFVHALCDQLQLPLVVHRVREQARSAATIQVSDEQTLRQIRREFFVRTAKLHGCRYVGIAHSADDQAETMLHHFIRGTGPLGLAGIAESSDLNADIVLRRPLLQVRRESLRAGLREIGQPWREDASNQLTHYTRNWIRGDVLPLVESRYPNVVEAIHRAGTLQRETNEMVRRMADQWLERYSELDDNRWTVHTERLSRSTNSDFSTAQSTNSVHWATERPIIVAASQLAWDRLGWPRGSMTMDHWQRLSMLIHADSQSISPAADSSAGQADDAADHGGHLPGGISLCVQADRLVLRSE
ncbi:tRNA lysidine(34) synthetase TilS [Rhodopirellula bahusiensis]|uniref:tRNA lysidine(34) synthetase TilS n=3 Tax=Rhodopirellula bahusiensis TaxID=2014065 RepID=UPI003263B950